MLFLNKNTNFFVAIIAFVRTLIMVITIVANLFMTTEHPFTYDCLTNYYFLITIQSDLLTKITNLLSYYLL